MSLLEVNLVPPKQLRGGWAALAAVLAARGWGKEVFATESQWSYHDGGGNWASLRFIGANELVLIGHDHEYTETTMEKLQNISGRKRQIF